VKRLVGALFLVIALCSAREAAAQDLLDRFSFRLDLTGMLLTEQQAKTATGAADQIAGPLNLGYGDLRLVLDGRRLPGNFDIHLDGRIRVTGVFPTQGIVASSNATGTNVSVPDATTARGYVGGREYDLTEMWVRGRWSKIDLGIGRLVVPEADAMRIDGVRLWVHLQKHWDLSIYAGGYPDPYSRSLNTDYVTGNALGQGTGIAFGGGASVRYSYDRIYGWFSANGAYLGGDDDGGPVLLNSQTGAVQTYEPSNIAGAPVGAISDYKTEKDRVWLTWSNFWRPIKYIDFFHDLVVDVAGAAGVQLTRLDFMASIHANKIFTLRLGYDHMSAIAIEMYLSHLLANRTDFVPGTIENNLTISRTARDEAHAAGELTFDRTMITVEGRLRRRVLDTPSNDPQFLGYNPTAMTVGTQVAPSWGGDGTVTIRNRGTVWGLRPALWFTYLHDYRAEDVFVGGSIGRDFLRDRLSLDVSFTYAREKDDSPTNPPAMGATSSCPLAGPNTALSQQVALQECWGTRNGHDIEPGLTLTATPAKHWFLFADYRADLALSYGTRYLITHVLLLRVEARY
jgi:hypothetical protein